MKKLLSALCTAVFLFCSFAAQAQLSVVRVDGNKVYLDISDQKIAPAKGSTFKVILSSEKLTNPQTGKDLGEIYNYSEAGVITEVQPLYAVGELKNTKDVKVGKQAVFEEIKPAPVVADAPAGKIPTNVRATTVYQPVEQVLISVTEADVTAPDAKNIITLSDDNKVTVFSRTGKDTLKEEMSFSVPKDKKALTISAAPVKEGLAQLFVSVYDNAKLQISTLVLENKEGTLQQTFTLPLFVKELGCGADKKIWGQRAFVLESAPGNAQRIVYEKNKFVASGEKFKIAHNFLQGSNFYPVESADKNNFITTTSGGSLRMFLNNGKRTESQDVFGSTPLRIAYKQEIIKFHPSLQVFGKPAEAVLVGVENTTKLGILSKTFGQYHRGNIHFLEYQKGRLKITDTVELDGVLYDTACTDTAILTAQILADGTSSLVEILK